MKTNEASHLTFTHLTTCARRSAWILVVCAPLALTACMGGRVESDMGTGPDSSTSSGKPTHESGTGMATGDSEGGDGPVEASSNGSVAGGDDSGASDSASGDVSDTGQTTGAPPIPDPDPGLVNEPGPGSDTGDEDAPDASDPVSTDSGSSSGG